MIVRGTVVRGKSTQLGTPGELKLDNEFDCETLELPWHDNERGRSCTLPDTYRGRVWWSPHLNRPVIKFDDKNGRKDCEIHNGNFAGDAFSQVHGCTEVGIGYGVIQRPDRVSQWGIKDSSNTLNKLIASLEIEGEEHLVGPSGFISGYNEVEITYQWAEGCEPV